MAPSNSKSPPAACTGVQIAACFLLIAQFLAIITASIVFRGSAPVDMALPAASGGLCLVGFRGLVPSRAPCMIEVVERVIRLWKTGGDDIGGTS